jgi:hypothetical protein
MRAEGAFSYFFETQVNFENPFVFETNIQRLMHILCAFDNGVYATNRLPN